MKISNKRQPQQIENNHSSYIDFQYHINLCKKCTAKPYSFLVFFIDTTIATVIFRVSKGIFIENIETNDDKIRDEKLLYNIKREATKISALSSGKIGKYEFPTGEEILPSDQCRIIEEAKFIHSLLGKAFQKQTKTIEEQGENQINVLEEHGKLLDKSSSKKEP